MSHFKYIFSIDIVSNLFQNYNQIWYNESVFWKIFFIKRVIFNNIFSIDIFSNLFSQLQQNIGHWISFFENISHKESHF